MDRSRSFILGTAGHVDHGKTTLVRALTGTDTDRLEEEHRRGISIELGFAQLELGEGVRLGIVDVPGHERFVRQMVAGAGGMDLALLLVAADEGVMPQTVEHFDVLRLLGVGAGLIVLTKKDLAEAELIEVVRAEVEELVEGSFLDGAPMIAVSASTGDGLDELRAALLTLAKGAELRGRDGDFRLPIDRVFSLAGTGVVVTGTAWSGEVGTGQKLRRLPQERELRVRELQSHDESVERAGAGERVALALHGIKRDEMERGEVLVSGASWEPSLRIGLRLSAVDGLKSPLKQRARVHVHHAAREVLGRLDLLEADEMAPGESMLVRLHLEEPLIAAPGDRLVLRSYSPMFTVAGGELIDPFSPAKERRADALDRLREIEAMGAGSWPHWRIRDAGLAGRSEAQVRSDLGMIGVSVEAARAWIKDAVRDGELVALGDRLLDPPLVEEAAQRALTRLREHQAQQPLSPGLPREELRTALGFRGGTNAFAQLLASWSKTHPIHLVEDRIRADNPRPQIDATQQAGLDALFRRIENASPVHEVSEEELRSAELALLVNQGQVVRLGGRLVAANSSLDELQQRVAAHFAVSDELAISHIKEWTGASRKFVVPLLEWLDSQDVTRFDAGIRRRGDACPS